MAENKKDGECYGVDFYIDESWKFYVPDLARRYDSYSQMEAALERDAEKVKRNKRTKIALPVVTENDVRFSIVGIHAGHGRIILSPKSESDDDGNHYYIDAPWIVAACKRKAELEADAENIGDVLMRFEIASDQAGGRSWDKANRSDCTPEGIANLHADLVKRASKTTLERELKIKVRDDDE